MTESCGNGLLTAISKHPLLRKLEFDLLGPVDLAFLYKVDKTKALVNMLLVNGSIVDIPFSLSAFDRAPVPL
jgi:hypothetical protein